MTLGGGKAEIYAVKIPEHVEVVGRTVREIAGSEKFPKECVFTGVYREDDGDFFIPRGDHVIRGGDTIFLVSKRQRIKPATDYLINHR